MGYWEISEMSQDIDLCARVQACAAQELPDADNPYVWQAEHMLDLAAQPGWDAAWSSALASGNEQPGRDPAVISDGMILSGVQAVAGTP
jgi:hypothetical protein